MIAQTQVARIRCLVAQIRVRFNGYWATDCQPLARIQRDKLLSTPPTPRGPSNGISVRPPFRVSLPPAFLVAPPPLPMRADGVGVHASTDPSSPLFSTTRYGRDQPHPNDSDRA